MSGPPMTVLVIEDDADVREVLADVLASYGYRVLTASDGQEGLDVLRGDEDPYPASAEDEGTGGDLPERGEVNL